MNFEIDKQTLADLNIFPDARRAKSVFEFYDLTQTRGGKEALMEMFYSPLNDSTLLKKRVDTIEFLKKNNYSFEFDYLEIDFIEHYLIKNMPLLRDNIIDSFFNWISNLTPSNNYYTISRGIEYLKAHITNLIAISQQIDEEKIPEFFKQFIDELKDIVEKKEFKLLLRPKSNFFSFRLLNYADVLIRKKEKESIRKILHYTKFLDAFSALALLSKQKGLSFAEYVDTPRPKINIQGLFHPLLDNPVPNDVALEDNNLCFVTGPNMAGKSTFLKSVGLCIYLAHLGFPVPARRIEISIFNGLYSTINLSDNLAKGHSHYYSEVKRVKDIVLKIKEKARVFVIFDELFKGTNVKDAYDATFMITTAFSDIKDCLFFISTHIIEVAEEMKKLNNALFKYLDSSLSGETAVYTYKLLDGISSERLGLQIIKKERIMEIIEEIIQKEKYSELASINQKAYL